MMASKQISGSCLCGAIKVQAKVSKPALRACHCEMCRKLTSSMFMSINTDQDSIQITGNVAVYSSSEWAERGFCRTCGSVIFYSTKEDGARNLSAGLFENAAHAPMKMEFFSDNCPSAYALAGDQEKLTAEQTIALFTGEGDNG
ncbi:MAG: GFA family protein [Paracoccaceae bacterium]